MLKAMIIGFAALFLFACASNPVDIDYDEGIDFSALHSFAWAADAPARSNNAKLDSDTLLHDRVYGEIENWLYRRGYMKTDPQRADFLVNYRVTLENRIETKVYDSYYGYPMGWGWGYYGRPYWSMAYSYPTQTSYEYQLSILIVDMLDPKTHKLIWRGSISYDTEDLTNPQEKRRKIVWAVANVLQNFPPQKAPR